MEFLKNSSVTGTYMQFQLWPMQLCFRHEKAALYSLFTTLDVCFAKLNLDE